MQQRNSPLVSVLMTAYNAEKYVGLAIESILEQRYENFEFIIVEDCSADDTWEIIQQYARRDTRIITIKNRENIKAGDSSNKGLKLCKGKYIVRMDADDWSYPDRIQKQVEYMEKHPEIVASGGSMVVCNENLEPIGVRYYKNTDSKIREEMLRLNPIPHPASIWRKDILLQTSLYNSKFSPSEDYALTTEISTHGKLGNITDLLVKFRVHSKSISNSRMVLQQRITLHISGIAIREYGYKATIKDIIWRSIQRITMYTLPPKLKRWLLNMLVLDRDLSKI